MLNNDRSWLHYNSEDKVYIIQPFINLLHTASRKVAIKYVGLVVIYKIIDFHNYLQIILDSHNL